MRTIDPFFQTKHRFVIIGKGKQQLGEVFVLGEQFIFSPKKARRGLRCVRVVGY